MNRPNELAFSTFLLYIHFLMENNESAKNAAEIESVQRIEPARVEEVAETITDVVAELSAAAAKLSHALHPRTATNLAGIVRIMNTYYSNLIEGHNTRPRDIARALAGDLDNDNDRRNLQLEAAAHVRVQAEVDRMAAEGRLPEPASVDFIRHLHRDFYRHAPEAMLRIEGVGGAFVMEPGEWRSRPGHDVAVGRHVPPSSGRVPDFMAYFADRYRFDRLGKAARIVAIPAAHHRFNYIHPLVPSRVSRPGYLHVGPVRNRFADAPPPHLCGAPRQAKAGSCAVA